MIVGLLHLVKQLRIPARLGGRQLALLASILRIPGSIATRMTRVARFALGALLRAARVSTRFVFPVDGGRFKLRFYPSSLTFLLWWNPSARREEREVITRLLREGDVFIDVGANIGTIAIPASKVVGSAGNVLAFEPNPRVFAYLAGNAALNGCTNLQAVNSALGSSRGEIAFSDSRHDDTNRVGRAKPDQKAQAGSITVSIKLLDDFTGNVDRVAVLKIDTEGYEKHVLEGANGTLEKCDCVYFECNDAFFRTYGYTARDVFSLLEGKGFSVYRIDDAAGIQPARPAGGVDNLLATRDPAFLPSRLAK